MRESHPAEQTVGIHYYVSDADGVGGQLKASPEDFRVREREAFDTEPLGSPTGDYPHLVFRATLTDWDTNDFVDTLASRVGISRERVSWAGTKDKRAVTTQLLSVKGLSAEELPTIDGATIEPVGRAGRPILFGDLAGNEFEITVRDATHPAHADSITEQLREFGDGEAAVPNYFGHQRFGTRRPITHRVGLELVRGDWEGAVLAYLAESSEREPERTREAREFVTESRDWQAALDRMPGHLRFERSMLHALVENGGESDDDFRAALERLPSNLQSLFVNAAQSYVFNEILSRRLERGLPFTRAVEGDVVCFTDSDAPEGLTVPDPDRIQRVTASRVDSVNRHCERGRAFVTAPLVGTETTLGEGEPGEIEHEVLDDVGIEPGEFDLPGNFDSSGTRRAILVRTALTLDRDPLTFSFSLPKGSYATVVLREYLKTHPDALA